MNHSDVVELRAEVARLREALEPFAVAAGKADAMAAEAKQLGMGTLSGDASTGLGIRFKHLWAARAALATEQTKESV